MLRHLARLCALAIAVTLLQSLPAHAAVTWTEVDRYCKSPEAGRVCTTVQTATWDGVKHYRARLSLAAASGHWIQPTTYDIYTWGRGSSGLQFCEPNAACARQTGTWVSAWESWTGQANVFRGHVTLDSGSKISVAAGITAWGSFGSKCSTTTSGKACVAQLFRMYRDQPQMMGRLTLLPASGRSMTPVRVRDRMYNSTASQSFVKELCTPSCTARTEKYVASVSGSYTIYDGHAAASAAWKDASGSHTVSYSPF